jgi:hypothetical protein
MTEGIDILTTPGGAVLTLQALPGRGWRCCRSDGAPHIYVQTHATLREALLDALPGLDEHDPWLIQQLLRRAPQEAPIPPSPES